MDKFNFQPTLRKSYLVQRLNKPETGGLANLASIFSFGGGLVNGGISKEGMAAIRGVFSFDYMGASEYEWGIVPSNLHFLASNAKDLVAGKVTIFKNKPDAYYLCHKDHADQVPVRIMELGVESHVKGGLYLDHHFNRPKWMKGEPRTVGWLDCSNGFMFFMDKDMFDKTCALFGVKNEL